MDVNLVIVTGAGGFLGRYAVSQLLEDGFTVAAVSRSASPLEHAACLPLRVDLEDPASIATLSQAGKGRTQALVHFAAALPRPGHDAEQCGRRNLRIDQHIRQVCERLECPLVYGSAAAYPARIEGLKTEATEMHPVEPYVREKIESEREFLRHFAASPASFTSLRISAPYGPGQTSTTVVRIFLDRALQDQPLMYHGSGTREQDFIHAADVARAVVSSVRQSPGGVFNIVSGTPVTMRQLGGTVVRAVSGCRSEVLPSGKPDPQEPRYASFSVEKARKQLGWAPAISLEDGIRQWAERIRLERRDAHCLSL